MNQQDIIFYEGAVQPKPKIYCVLHPNSEITHGCTVQDCQHPFYCGSCSAHQHDQHDFYASLKNIDQFIFDISQKVKVTQQPFKSVYNQILGNTDNLNLIKWQADIEPHIKSIENYVHAQKQLISQDIVHISNKVYEIMDTQRQQVFKKLDDFLVSYRMQFTDFKQYHDHLFQILKQKYKYLGDCNALSAKMNSLDAKLLEEFILDLRESIQQSENIIKNSGFNIIEIEKIFKDVNQLTNRLPNYKQLSDFEVAPSIQGQTSIKILDQLKVQLEGHFKEACVNFFQPIYKISIPQNQMPPKKYNFMNFGKSSQGNGYLENMQGSNANTTRIMPPPLAHLNSQHHQHSHSAQNGSSTTANITTIQNYQSQNGANSPNFFGQNFDNLAISQNRTKPKIFQTKQNSRGGGVNSPANNIVTLNLMQNSNTNNTASSFAQNLPVNIPQQVPLQRQNTYGNQGLQHTASATNLTQNSQAFNTGAILNSNYLKLKKDFQIKLNNIPKFICYLANGFIAMASLDSPIRILDTNNNTIITGSQIIRREIKFLASLQSSNEGLYQTEYPTALNFALSDIDSVITLYQFRIKTREIIQKNNSIIGFSAPVSRIVDLYPITNTPLLAAGDENGEVSIFDYEKTIGYGLEKCHVSAISQLMVMTSSSNAANKYTSYSSQSNQPNKFMSFSSEDQVLVIYVYVNEKFEKQSIFNVSNFGGGVLYLRNHPELEQFVAVCKNGTLKQLKLENKNIIEQNIDNRARDIAVFSVKESLFGNKDYYSIQNRDLTGLIFTSEQENDKLSILKATNSSPIIEKEQTLFTVFSPRKILYVDNKNKLFIVINDANNYIQVYEIQI
ncbi:hypothetical protein TTHERM_01068070 (macronuclear) [Tetrahymena thermophila SB210]|uniref:Uncharacterized protein n=1 Tax=Tetrahymena thermophila (strain SB210) TaxID=312017 RepID=Q22CA3_TETTS|nr:hypothetical protein TTHERM_01068070 [Tetrahymena thermophila SB210]EAR82904.2 hypothetical protein TTHERM_01068070 [Tetrahymena thermophila SB210]|eukprot:XP_001030567.2 hypothetical protein TTHERM_01068070 [Tetrahymena thermophila SB210]